MHNLRKKKRFTVTMLIVIMTVFMAVPVMAGEADYTIQYSEDNYLYGENNESAYGLVIDDQANLFSDIQEKRIMSYMSDCALGGHIILVTLDVNGYSSAYDFAKAYYRSMIQPAQAINDICTEIVSCLNEHHMKMFVDMVCNGIDIAAFLMQEGSVLMDTEKEMSAVSRVRRMIEGVQGEWVDKECAFSECVYRKTHKMLETYFKSYQSTTSSQFTQYDLEQIEHAHKNVLTMKRLLTVDTPIELKDVFNLNNIMMNIQMNKIGIDVSYIKYLMEEAAKGEQRNQYVSQLADIERTIENMKKLLLPTDNMDDMIAKINSEISSLQSQDRDMDSKINECSSLLDTNDRRRLLMSQVKHINIDELNHRYGKLNVLLQKLTESEQEFSSLSITYNDLVVRSNTLSNELTINM